MSLILVDGSALIYRAYYAFASRPLTAPGGEQVSVCFGFLNSVLRLIESRRPEYLALVFDRPEPTFRHQRYEAYKATRKPMPGDLAAQLPRLRQMLAAWGAGLCELAGWEADDVMATLARRSAERCSRAWFYTGDKDFLQCLDARTAMLKPGRRGDDVTEVTPDDVRREWGLAPADLVDVFALSGDSSDNIPGAPGIGEKTATQLIRRFGSLDGLYERLEDPALTPRLRRILTEHRDQVMLSRELFRIDADVPLAIDWDCLRTRLPRSEAAFALMQELGLRQLQGLVRRLASAGLEGAAAPSPRASGVAPGGESPTSVEAGDTASPSSLPQAGRDCVRLEAPESARTQAGASGDVSAPAPPGGWTVPQPEASREAGEPPGAPPLDPDSAAATPAELEAAGPRRPPEEPGATPAGPAAPYTPEAAAAEMRARGYRILRDHSALLDYIENLDQETALAVDTETDSLRPDRARLVGISLSSRPGEAAYVPIRIRQGSGEGVGGAASAAPAADPREPATLFSAPPPPAETSNLEWVRPLLAPLLGDGRLKIGHNLKFDAWVLGRHGLELAGPAFDTLVAAYVLDPGRSGYGLDELAGEQLGHRNIAYAELFAPSDRVRDIMTVPLERLALSAAEDAEVARRLHDAFAPALADAGLDPLFRTGIRVDREFLGELRARFAAELERLAARIQEVAGERFNVNSPQQLARILFEKLRLAPLKKTSTGWSTDVSVLSELAERHPLPALVLEHRQVAKLQGTYVDALSELVDPATGLVHTSFNQAVAATGRLSSSDPNLQNIPVRTELGRLIRRAFVPRSPANVFLSADYSQIELRLLAHLSGDASLQAAFRDGVDVHRRTAALIARVAEPEVTTEMRRRAKAINFGVVYGMGARALARQTGVTTREATHFIDSYFATYPGVKAWIAATREQARRERMVATLLGRRRLLPEIDSRSDRTRALQERIAVNTPIQGTAADLIKLAMIRLDRRLREAGGTSLLLLQVHDELLLEVPRAEVASVTTLVRDCMEKVWELAVPLVVDVHCGDNWAEAHA
jgi:DNA polymerase-1